jgi:hypothetical protein
VWTRWRTGVPSRPGATLRGDGSRTSEDARAYIARRNSTTCDSAQNLAAGFGKNANEGIIGRVQDEGGHRDTVEHMRGCGAVVIIVGSGEAAIERGDPVVKLAQAVDASEAGNVERARKQASLGPQPPIQLPQEILLVQPVARQRQGVGRGREIDRRTDRSHSAKLARTRASPFAGQLQHQIAAHGESGQSEAGD